MIVLEWAQLQEVYEHEILRNIRRIIIGCSNHTRHGQPKKGSKKQKFQSKVVVAFLISLTQPDSVLDAEVVM